MTDSITQFVREIDALIAENQHLRERVAKLESKPMDNRPKLTDNDVRMIRAAHRQGMAQKDLADNYGVNAATISRIVRGLYH